MLDRVVAALVAVVLLLFSVSSALACGECDRGTAQCLVSLELQAGEVLSTDLEVVTSLGSETWAEPFDTQNDTNAMATISEQDDHVTIERSAAGVHIDPEGARDDDAAARSKGRHGVGV